MKYKTLASPLAAAIGIAVSFNAAAADPVADWGLGLGVGVEFYEKPYVEEASLQGTERRVVLTDTTKSEPSFWAVGNWTWEKGFGDTIKPGIFTGVRLIGQEGAAIDAVAIGLQVVLISGNERKSATNKVIPSWNFGIGYVNHKTRHLADGITANEPLPAAFTDIVYRKRSEGSWILMISRNFTAG